MSAIASQPRKRLEAFTPEHFKAYASRIILDTGEPWEVEDFQMEVFEPILRGVKEVWAIIPEGNTKAEWVHTRLPTPDGWTTMLDVQPGDQLLGSDGQPTTVTRISEVKFEEDCYQLRFSDGYEAVVGGDHLWSVEDAQDHYNTSVRTTRWLYNRPLKLPKKGKEGNSAVARWRVQTAGRAHGSEVDLPVDPYVLGVWLGDGSSAAGSVTSMDAEIWEALQGSMGLHPISPSNLGKIAPCRYVIGLAATLRRAGLLGNKHIPSQYLIAPEEVRWRLLQGLVDTDGCVTKAGLVRYDGTNERLVDDVRRLVWSLGLPCSKVESRAVLNGVDYGPNYSLTISCDARHPVTSLPRKRERLKQYGLTCDHRRIVSIERVQSVPVKCIQVDSPDRLYLTGDAFIPTHNTTMMAGLALYHADFTRQPWVPIAASSRDQAEILAQQAYAMIRSTPRLPERFRIYEGYRKITSLANHGRGIKVYAADANTGDGVIPTLALCDEGHRWPSLEVYRLWRGKLNKRGGQIVMISTAGEPGGEFEETRDEIRRRAHRRTVNGAHVRSEGANIVMNEWRVESDADVTNCEKVKAANPFSGITVEDLQEDLESPTTDLGEFKRLKCNIPSRTVLAAITEKEWSKARSKYSAIPEGQHVDVGADVAWKHDTFAIVPLWQAEEFKLLGKPKILTPPRDGTMLAVDDVKFAFQAINDVNPIDAVVIDIERAEDVAQWLEDELGIEIVDRPQGNANAVEDYDAFMKELRNGRLQHTGDSEFYRHVMNAIARQLPSDKRRFDRPSQSRAKKRQVVRVIDALTAAGMVNHYAGEMTDFQPLVGWR